MSVVRESSLPIKRNARVTTGLMCAPLRIPTGDSAISAPMVPNRKPEINLRDASLGKRLSTGLPSPNMKMTSDRPANTSSAVPTSSETNILQAKTLAAPPFSAMAASLACTAGDATDPDVLTVITPAQTESRP